ncbi:DNA translocase FtsK [Yersinia pseudotuberculosis]|uniref:DNA translocase FtsK n=1 Tax=Yersinia pseudotuberculosis TaxID=633 RepID=UPI0005DB1B84|nr:DNA translocase FtsK [Yersinia pseudotuberculosis]CNB74603.1 Ftsk gamma domain [Yersinia pseudotuberculosis]
MPTELNKELPADPLYDETLNMLVSGELGNNVTAVQHHFNIGYNRAANLVEKIRQDNVLLIKDR